MFSGCQKMKKNDFGLGKYSKYDPCLWPLTIVNHLCEGTDAHSTVPQGRSQFDLKNKNINYENRKIKEIE